jgi:DASH family cryptochrome
MDEGAAFVSAGCLPSRRCVQTSAPCAPCLARAALTDRSLSARAAAPGCAAAPARLPLPLLASRAYPPAQPSAPAAGPTVVVWFRGDLRLHDHPALTHALEEAGTVVPVYCFDPRQFGKTPFGFEKTGRYRAKFLVEAVADLRAALQKKGADLFVRQGRPEDVVPELCRSVGATSVFYHREVSYEEQQVEQALSEVLSKSQVEAKPFWANTLYHAEDLPFHVDDMPDVYTEFREAVQREGTVRAPLPTPEAVPPLRGGIASSLDMGAVPTLRDLGLVEPDPGVHGMHAFRGGEVEALSRLDMYISESRTVPDGRSVAVHLGADFSCKISPWLALGCLSPRRIHADLCARAAKAGQTSTYFELIWRDFFRFITQKYAHARLRGPKESSSSMRERGATANAIRATAATVGGHGASARATSPARNRAPVLAAAAAAPF